MTERLYYENSLMQIFSARVTRVKEENGVWKAALNQSAFYPTSGGQPFDTGVLLRENGARVRVSDVEADESGEVWHTLDCPLEEGEDVAGEIDWPRRLDHMEQHGGEHLLAGAIWRLLHGVTIGLHCGERDATIDVNLPGGETHMTGEEIALLEDTVNEEIRADVPVRCWFPSPEELPKVPLRKPPAVREHVRVVAFGDFEYCACGGTHPPSSGRIGLIKILSVTPARGKARVRFVCGGRAVRFFQQCYTEAERAGEMLSCPGDELAAAVGGLQKMLAAKDAENAALGARLNGLLMEKARKEAETLPGGEKLISLFLPAENRALLRDSASELIREPGVIALCASPAGEGYALIFARSADVEKDMRALLRETGAKGGGRVDFAQGNAGDAEILSRAAGLLTQKE